MSLLPMLVGLYIASQFIHYPFENTDTLSFSFIMLCTLALSYLGYKITQQMLTPIIDATHAAEKIAEGKLDEVEPELKGADELEDLSKSLKTITKNARELLEKVEKLSLKDKLTGLYNASYIRERLNEEIQRAIHYQRPCSFVYFGLERFDEFIAKTSVASSEEMLKAIAGVINRHLSEFDRAARVNKHDFALIFPDKNKKKAIQIVENIQKDLADIFAQSHEELMGFSIGISENPIDGISSDELYVKAQGRAHIARKNGSAVEAFA